MKTKLIPVMILLLPALIRAEPEPEPDLDLETITVTASKSQRPATEIAAPVTVITDEEADRILAESIRDLIRYEPGITVPFQGQRFGLAGFNIRGLGGNRVQIQLDGVRISDSFAIGSFTNAARNFVDVDALKQTEILRGPASSLFGSSALGGVVAFTTKDPADWLRGSDGKLTSRLRGGWYSADDGWVASGLVAGGDEDFSSVIHYTERRGHELDNQGETGGSGSGRTRPNPHDYTSRNLLAKFLLGEDTGNTWRLTLDANESDSETDVLSGRGIEDFTAMFGFPYIVETTDLAADDNAERYRVSLDQALFDIGVFDRIGWQVYWQESTTEQDTFEARTTTIMGQPGSVERYRTSLFEQTLVGAEVTTVSRFTTGEIQHDLVAGAEIYRTETRQSRDGFVLDLASGETSSVVGPDDFPVRDFPNSETLEAGIYVEDRIAFGERFTLIPGLRVDYYDLDPEIDSIFAEDNPGIEPEGLTETPVTPRLGAILELSEHLDLFAQYARGFRSPPYNDVNVGFTNFQFGYTAIPNPDLEPETSDGFELGLRASGRTGWFSLAAYENRYDDFIESFVSQGVDPDTGLLVFQSQNLTDVRIRGVEFKGFLDLGHFNEALDDWGLRAAAAWSKGDDQSRDVPLNSVEPLNGVLGLQWQPAGLPVEAELVATAVAGKDEDRVDDTAGELFIPGGHVTLDLLLGWRLGESGRVRAGIFNLTDKTYWAWSDVRGRPADDPALERYSRPGRNYGLSASWQF